MRVFSDRLVGDQDLTDDFRSDCIVRMAAVVRRFEGLEGMTKYLDEVTGGEYSLVPMLREQGMDKEQITAFLAKMRKGAIQA